MCGVGVGREEGGQGVEGGGQMPVGDRNMRERAEGIGKGHKRQNDPCTATVSKEERQLAKEER